MVSAPSTQGLLRDGRWLQSRACACRTSYQPNGWFAQALLMRAIRRERVPYNTVRRDMALFYFLKPRMVRVMRHLKY